MPQPPPGRPSGPIQRPGQPAARPPAPATRQVAPVPPQRPSSGGTQRTTSQPPASPGTQRVTKPAAPPPAAPAASPGTQRVARPAAPPPPAPATRQVAPVPPQRPTSGGTQRASKPPAAAAAAPPPEAPGATPGVPPSKKFLRPTKMQAAMADASPDNDPRIKKKMTKGRLIFNLTVYLSIPICIGVIVWRTMFSKDKNLLNKASDLTKGENVGEKPKPVTPQKSKDQLDLEQAHADLGEAQTEFAKAELDETPPAEKKQRLDHAKALVEKIFAVVQPISEKPEYQSEGFEYITKDLEKAAMLKRVLNDRLKAFAPPDVEPPAVPNTRALGIVASWNGTPQKFAVVFLDKSVSPNDAAMKSLDWPASPLKDIELKPLPVERVFEFTRGAVKDEFDKMEAGAKGEKAAALAASIEVFEGAKFTGPFAYAHSMNGTFWKGQLAKFSIRIHEDRGVGCFKEYHELLLQAIGSPVKGKESVSAGFCEWNLIWQKEGVVYRLQAIGNPKGMEMTLTAFNEANQKAMCEAVGETDPFADSGMDDWSTKSATFPAVPDSEKK